MEKLAGLVRKRQSGDGDINDDEIRGIAQSVDIKWAHLQCARRQAGADSSEAVVSSPALSYQLNLSECVRHRDGGDFNKARGAAHRAIDQAIRSRISKDVVTGFSVGAAKLAYDSWDYLALLPAGYMATAARAPTKMLLKTFGKSLLKKRLFQPSWVKFGVRGATLGANTLITDFSVQSMVAAREYVEACLQGDCSPSKISENFVYTQEEADSKRHVARLMATAVANYGLDLLWGKARVFAPRSLSSLTDNKLGRWVVETSKGSVNMVVTESVGTMTEGSIGECEVPAIDILADEKKWMEAFKGSVFSKLKGSKKRSGRYVSVSLLPRLFDLGITELTPEEIQNIEKCTSFSEGDQGASLVEQDKSK